jgi:catechol 2,3-dioxygenase-like lactoylglutathione lyase family enzyme
MAEFPSPLEGILLGYFIVSDDVERSRRFYTDVLGGRVLFSGPPAVVALSNTWIVINAGGGPTDDKPAVTLETPRDLDRVSSFLNFRVKDIEAVYAEWSARGAQFLTPPKRHPYETRCYIRDPDGYLIEVADHRPTGRLVTAWVAGTGAIAPLAWDFASADTGVMTETESLIAEVRQLRADVARPRGQEISRGARSRRPVPRCTS